MGALFFEDIEVGSTSTSEEHAVSREEIIEFARAWDPQPFHVDDAAASHSIFAGLSACTAHVFAIQTRLAHSLPDEVELLAGLGNDGFELLAPVRPGDRVHLVRRFVDKRESKTKPDRGIVRIELLLTNQSGTVVFRALGRMMVARRPPAGC